MGSEESDTLFALLGVSPDATAEQIERAWKVHFLKAGGVHGQIPVNIREAYRLLSVEETRKSYSDLLKLCDSGDVLDLRPNEIPPLERTCNAVGLRLHRNRYNSRECIVLRNGQAAPNWVRPTEPRAGDPPPPPVWWIRIFDQNHIAQTVGVLVTALLLIVGATYGIQRGAEAYHARQVRLAEAAFSMSSDQASKILGDIHSETTRLLAEFRAATGCEPTDDKWSDEINPIMLTHPEFRASWHEFVVSLPTDEQLAAFDKKAAAVTRLPANQIPTAADIASAQSFVSELSNKLTVLKDQQLNVDHVRNILETAKYNRAIGGNGRNN